MIKIMIYRLHLVIFCVCTIFVGCRTNNRKSNHIYGYKITSNGSRSSNGKYVCTIICKYFTLRDYNFRDIEKIQYYSSGSSDIFLPNLEITDQNNVRMLCDVLNNYSYIEEEKETLYSPGERSIGVIYRQFECFSSCCTLILIDKNNKRKYQIYLGKYLSYTENQSKNTFPEYKIDTISGEKNNACFKNDVLTFLLNEYLPLKNDKGKKAPYILSKKGHEKQKDKTQNKEKY